MVADQFYLGVYWGPRRETVEECATRTAQLLSGLRTVDPAFEYWLRPISEPTARHVHVDATRSRLMPLFAAGAQRANDGRPMPQLGFMFGLWNDVPSRDSGSSLSVSCGGFAEQFAVINSCVLSFPTDASCLERLLEVETMLDMMRIAAEAMQPDWGTVCSRKLRDLVGTWPRLPQVGLVTFLSSAKYSAVPDLPSPAKAIEVGGRGTMILLTEERFSTESEQDLGVAQAVVKALGKHGILRVLS